MSEGLEQIRRTAGSADEHSRDPGGDGWDDAPAHYAHVYESDREQLAAIARFLGDGLDDGDRCVCVHHERTAEAVARALRAEGVDVAAARETDRLAIRPAAETYLAESGVSRADDAAWVAAELDRTPGDRTLRVVGEMTWAVDEFEDLEALVEYEDEAERVVAERDLTTLCQYDRRAFPDDVLADVLASHGQIYSADGARENAIAVRCSAEERTGEGREFDSVIETVRDATRERTHREAVDRLAAVAAAVQHGDDQDRTALIEALLDLTTTVCSVTLATVAWFDRETNGLTVDGAATRTTLDEPAGLVDRLEDLAWEAFASDEVRVASASGRVEDPAADAVETCLGLPMGRYGVVLVAVPEHAGLTATEERVLRTAVTTVRTALDAAAGRDALAERETELERRERQIDRLAETNAVVRRAVKEVADATTRTEIERSVCDLLAETAAIDCAWIAGVDDRTAEIAPRYVAAPAASSLASEDHLAAVEPARTAARTDDPVAVADLHDDPPFEEWRERALRDGLRSVLSVPLTYAGSTYGVLTVFGRGPGAFEDRRSVLEDVGTVTAHALNAWESKRALVSDAVTELRLSVRGREAALVRAAADLDAEVRLEGVVSGDHGGLTVYVAVEGTDPAAVERCAERTGEISETDHVASADGEHVFGWTVGEGSLFQRLVDVGAVPTAATAAGDEGELTIEVSQETSTRSVLSMLEGAFDDVVVRSQQDREREFKPRAQFEQAFEAELTDRQLEILQTAYYSGFFESPRESTGQDVADQLDLSQPTVTEHVRTAERKVFELLFDR